MYCLDANVWVYFFDADLEEHERVEPAVSSVLSSEPLFTTTVLQMEVVHYVSNQLAESEAILEEFFGMDGVNVTELTPADVERAAALLDDYANTGLGGRDASVLAAIERHDVSELWTHDEAFATVARDLDDLTVRDPVKSGT